MSNKTSAFIGAVAVLWMVLQVPELSFLAIPALIIGAIMVLKGENKDKSEKSIREYGVDLWKPKEKWTAEDYANFKAKQLEKTIKSGCALPINNCVTYKNSDKSFYSDGNDNNYSDDKEDDEFFDFMMMEDITGYGNKK